MEVFGVPPKHILAQAKRKQKFFLEGNIPIKMVNKKGKFRIPGSINIEKIIRTDDALFMDFIKQCLIWDPKQRLTPLEAL